MMVPHQVPRRRCTAAQTVVVLGGHQTPIRPILFCKGQGRRPLSTVGVPAILIDQTHRPLPGPAGAHHVTPFAFPGGVPVVCVPFAWEQTACQPLIRVLLSGVGAWMMAPGGGPPRQFLVTRARMASKWWRPPMGFWFSGMGRWPSVWILLSACWIGVVLRVAWRWGSGVRVDQSVHVSLLRGGNECLVIHHAGQLEHRTTVRTRLMQPVVLDKGPHRHACRYELWRRPLTPPFHPCRHGLIYRVHHVWWNGTTMDGRESLIA